VAAWAMEGRAIALRVRVKAAIVLFCQFMLVIAPFLFGVVRGDRSGIAVEEVDAIDLGFAGL
jgi:hypothetical protein